MFNKTTTKIFLSLLLVAFMAFAALPAHAKVSAEEAERLKNDLTPTGAERAGNADGTIPAWEGGLTKIPDHVTYDPESDATYPDPYADDKVLFTITAQNVDQYADKLSEGQKEMFRTYPDTWKMNIYPTRRSYAAPQDYYDRVYHNALNVELVQGGDHNYKGDYDGYPFPIPKNGVEAILNNGREYNTKGYKLWNGNYVVYGDGTIEDTGSSVVLRKFPAYYLSREEYQANNFRHLGLSDFNSPARRKGELGLVNARIHAEIEGIRHRYMPGQRRIRRSMDMAYDTPLDSTGGNSTVDDVYLFYGQTDRYDWKLNGKKEMYIPYNNYAILLCSVEDLFTPKHINPELVRYELHRIWEVDSTLKEGSRHCYGRRVFYMDEDSWIIAMRDAYDTRGVLWRFALQMTNQVYEIPLYRGHANIYFDFQTDTYSTFWVVTGLPKTQYNVEFKDSVFTTQNLRKMGRR